MDEKRVEDCVVISTEAEWPDTLPPALRIYAVHIDHAAKHLTTKVILDHDITDDEKDEFSCIETLIISHLPDEWRYDMLFLTPEHDQVLTPADKVMFVRGDLVTPRDRYKLRRAQQSAGQAA